MKAQGVPKLYAIVDVEVCAQVGRAPIDVTRAFLTAGVRWLQLRAKRLPGGAFLELAREVTTAATRSGATLIVNDRADIAALSRAHGLHVGQDDLPATQARRLVGEAAILGLSTHTESQLTAAVSQPISYLAVGPVFGTATKETGHSAVGLEWVRRAADTARRSAVPLVAIGGITIERAASVIESGADSVAVISDLLVGDPEARARAFLDALR